MEILYQIQTPRSKHDKPLRWIPSRLRPSETRSPDLAVDIANERAERMNRPYRVVKIKRRVDEKIKVLCRIDP